MGIILSKIVSPVARLFGFNSFELWGPTPAKRRRLNEPTQIIAQNANLRLCRLRRRHHFRRASQVQCESRTGCQAVSALGKQVIENREQTVPEPRRKVAKPSCEVNIRQPTLLQHLRSPPPQFRYASAIELKDAGSQCEDLPEVPWTGRKTLSVTACTQTDLPAMEQSVQIISERELDKNATAEVKTSQRVLKALHSEHAAPQPDIMNTANTELGCDLAGLKHNSDAEFDEKRVSSAIHVVQKHMVVQGSDDGMSPRELFSFEGKSDAGLGAEHEPSTMLAVEDQEELQGSDDGMSPRELFSFEGDSDAGSVEEGKSPATGKGERYIQGPDDAMFPRKLFGLKRNPDAGSVEEGKSPAKGTGERCIQGPDDAMFPRKLFGLQRNPDAGSVEEGKSPATGTGERYIQGPDDGMFPRKLFGLKRNPDAGSVEEGKSPATGTGERYIQGPDDGMFPRKLFGLQRNPDAGSHEKRVFSAIHAVESQMEAPGTDNGMSPRKLFGLKRNPNAGSVEEGLFPAMRAVESYKQALGTNNGISTCNFFSLKRNCEIGSDIAPQEDVFAPHAFPENQASNIISNVMPPSGSKMVFVKMDSEISVSPPAADKECEQSVSTPDNQRSNNLSESDAESNTTETLAEADEDPNKNEDSSNMNGFTKLLPDSRRNNKLFQ